MIDVVIPIYNAYDALKSCLQSLQSNQLYISNVLLINDASTDLRISPLINKFALKNNWDVIERFENKGFVKTANLGLTETEENTILLNSDTIVSKNWDKAFVDALESNDDIGTMTSWSNNAEICSFPEFLLNNKIPTNINEISEALYKYWTPIYPELPTAVGFCMMITKLSKLRVGVFDEQQFGHGYGEENDYSLRVKQAGLRNILCDNAYVAHRGNESFSEIGLKPNEESMKKLLAKHPAYLDLINQYINENPLAEIRDKIEKILIEQKIMKKGK